MVLTVICFFKHRSYSGAIWFYYVLLATPTPNHESVKNLKRTRTGRLGPYEQLSAQGPHKTTLEAVEAVRLSAVKRW